MQVSPSTHNEVSNLLGKDKTQKLHERPMLKPATDKVAPKCADIFEQEAERRIAKEISNNLRR